jgi:ATP-dependent DNA helicase DinG
LQQQLLEKDIPAIQQHTELSFGVVQGKGRGRYYCPMAAEQASYDLQAETSLFNSESAQSQSSEALLRHLKQAFDSQQWSGDLDQLSTGLTAEQRQAVTITRSECIGSVCAFYEVCPYYRQRALWQEADVIVVNHDLVLSDLLLGGGVILPAPEQSVYIFDEAHHLPEKSLQHFQQRLSYSDIQRIAESLPRLLQKGLVELDAGPVFAESIQDVQLNSGELSRQLQPFIQLLKELPLEQEHDRLIRIRFKDSNIPEPLKVVLLEMKQPVMACHKVVSQIQQWLMQQLRDHQVNVPLATALTQSLKRISDVLASTQSVCDAFCRAQSGEDAAFWFEYQQQPEQGELCCSPFFSRNALQNHLFNRAWGVVMTSATLSVAGHFNRFMDHTGIMDAQAYCRVSGAFNYAEQGELWIPQNAISGSDVNAHTEDLIKRLPSLLEDHLATLVLFASRQQMERVFAGLPTTWQDRIQCQGEANRETIIERHSERLNQGQHSAIFGLDSFAEGVDLPGATLTQVIIAKLPFRMPDDPVFAAAAESIDRSGGQSFMQITLPDAIMKLTQAVGRLIRTRTDEGRVVILDGRVHTARYGSMIVSSLPPFRRRH